MKEIPSVIRNWRFALGLLSFMLATAGLLGGGSGLNVVVVVNTNSSASLQLGNYYCEQRGVPPQNVLRLGWTGGNTDWARADFEARLRTPLNELLNRRKLTNQIEYVLLSMDIPYRVFDGGTTLTLGTNATTSALFYGFKPDGCVANCPAGYSSCTLGSGAANNYAGSEGIFRQTPPISAASNSWLTMMLTASNLTQAKLVVDRGVMSDSSFPTQSVYLIHYEPDPLRGVRHYQYDDAVFEDRVRGMAKVQRVEVTTPGVTPTAFGYQLGSQYGLSSFNLSPGLFAPGALADNLTSFGGYLFENRGQTTALGYLNAGAVASYGTVAEPCNYLEKFPAPRNYFYQSRGFSAAECYYLSVTNPYQGVLVGEPLATPFAFPASGVWLSPTAGATLTGTTNLAVHFTAADPSRPLHQVDLFVDGTYASTLTNLSAQPNNRLYVTLNGFTTNYLIAPNATLESVASALTSRLNRSTYYNATKVTAIARGDRIELRSQNLAARGSQLSLVVSNYQGSASLLTAGLVAGRTDFLDTSATGLRSFLVTNATLPDSVLTLAVTKTNGQVVSVSVTNSSANSNNDPAVLVKNLVTAINAEAALQGQDGVVAVDFFSHAAFGAMAGEFNLRARQPGWPEAQITAQLTASLPLLTTPTGNQPLDENASDLQPRAHLYVVVGLTNLDLSFPLDSTALPDGFHELTVVAYEGSHVRTQKRISQPVKIRNSPLTAVLNCLLCDTNTALEATLQFQVAANTNAISRIELFSTGGSWGVVSNQSSSVFSLAATNLGAGLHPFYAMVTRNDGQQYRTETRWIRLVESDPPFQLTLESAPPTLAWPASAGRRYEILSTTNLATVFSVQDSLVPTNSQGRWSETSGQAASRYYRLRTSP